MVSEPTFHDAYAAHLLRPRRAPYVLVLLAEAGTDLRRGIDRAEKTAFGLDLVVAVRSAFGPSAKMAVAGTTIRAVVETGSLAPEQAVSAICAFARDEGYKAVICADGGLRHGLDALATMLDELDRGCEFIQGSAYAAGGRVLANSHAAKAVDWLGALVARIATGSRWTDPVCSYRAYAGRMLEGPVAPGAQVLVQVARSRCRAAEIPVTRVRSRPAALAEIGRLLAAGLRLRMGEGA